MLRLARVTSATAVAGGLAWIAACVALAALPDGCVDEECLTRPEQPWTPTATALVLLAFFLVTASGLGLVVLALVRGGGRLAWAAAAAGALGTLLLVVGFAMAALEVPGMDDAMPGFVVSGALLLVTAVALTAWLAVQSRLLPTWVAIVLGVGAVLLLFVNEQNNSVLLAVPFGAGWAVAGVRLVSGGVPAPDRRSERLWNS